MAASSERRKIFDSIKHTALESKEIPLDMGRRILAYEMATSGKEIPPIGFNYEPDITALMAFFKKLKTENNIKLSVNTLLMRCVVEGLKAAPILNSRLNYKYAFAKGTLTMHEHVNINMPTILPDGTMQAVNIKNAETMSLRELDSAVNDLMAKLDDHALITKAQVDLALDQTMGFFKKGKVVTGTKRLIGSAFGKERIIVDDGKGIIGALVDLVKDMKKPADKSVINKHDLEEGTLMITNVGSLYKEMSGNVTMFEIIPPEIFAVCLGTMQRRAVVKTDENSNEVIVPVTIMPMCLLIDHKAVDFGDLIPFIKRLDDIFANPEQIVDWL